MKKEIQRKIYLQPSVHVMQMRAEQLLAPFSGQHAPIGHAGQSGDAKTNPFSAEEEDEEQQNSSLWED